MQLVLLLATYNIALDSASSLLSIFESIQVGLLNSLIKSVISINIVKIRAPTDRRIALVGSLKLIDISGGMAATALLESIIQCLSLAQRPQTSLPEREDEEEESHTADASYSPLTSIPSPVNDAACDCEDLARSGIIQSAAIGVVVRWESIHQACLLPQLPNTLMLPLLQPPLCLPPCLHSLSVRWCASVDLA